MKGEYWISSGRISRICPGLSSANMLLGPGARTSRCLPPLARGPGLGLRSLLGEGELPVTAAKGCWICAYGEYGW